MNKPTLIKNSQRQPVNLHKPVRQRIRQNSMRRHHDLNILQHSIPDRLLSPELDFIQTRQDPRPRSWYLGSQDFVLLEAQGDGGGQEPDELVVLAFLSFFTH